jgi:pimeloyl-ACP methyl ester carboxylesterase
MKAIFAAVLALALGACQTDKLVTKQADDPRPTSVNFVFKPKGPQVAKGAVLFVHGGDYRSGEHDLDKKSPRFLTYIDGIGFDVFRLDLAPRDQNAEAVFDRWLPSAVADFRRQRYKKVYVVGQSAGGFTALIAARNDIRFADGAIAFAPTWNANDPVSTILRIHRETLFKIAPSTRVAIFHFRNDELAGRWHKEAVSISNEVFAGRRNAMVRVPPGDIEGHGAIGLQEFANIYGKCLAEFLAADDPNERVCPP